MKRIVVLGLIVGLALALMTAGLIAQQGGEGKRGAPEGKAGGQARGGGGGGIGNILKVADRLYMIPGAGGNTAVFLMQNGVLIVDTKNPNNGQGILDQIKTVTDKNITHIINTHTHGD